MFVRKSPRRGLSAGLALVSATTLALGLAGAGSAEASVQTLRHITVSVTGTADGIGKCSIPTRPYGLVSE
jgi:hypothetical protein